MLLSDADKLALAERIKQSPEYPQSNDEISDPEYIDTVKADGD